ncbi:hypothetical protein [Treponema succinifaciens]|uniref:hypothetical protein n=1 Tax=Treponema succinifaciens TaxID=167 RepID=UPI0023F40010|nr:hypothetical protein [Treponema succinifaciens]
MKKINPFLLLFIFMGFCLAILYGFFELGDFWMMETTEKILMTIFGCLIVITAIIICVEIWKSKPDIVAIENSKIILDGKFFSSVCVLADDTGKVPAGVESIVITGNFCLCKNHFTNLNNVKKIYFFNKKHRIDADLFESAKDKIVLRCKKKKLIVEFH